MERELRHLALVEGARQQVERLRAVELPLLHPESFTAFTACTAFAAFTTFTVLTTTISSTLALFSTAFATSFTPTAVCSSFTSTTLSSDFAATAIAASRTTATP